MAAAVVAIGLLARNTTLQPDEWSYANRVASQPLATAVFNSPHGYLIALPMLIFAGLLHTFGLGSYVPFRVVGLIFLVASDALFFELARRRIGSLAALPLAVILLFLGSGSEVVLVPVRMPSLVALAAGLGMLLALERGDRRGDVAACILLFVALTSHPLGIAFAAAASVAIVLRPQGERLKRWWIVLPPIALLALWWVTLHGSPGSSASSTSPGDIVSFVAQTFVAVCAAATGFFRAPWGGGADFLNPFSVAVAVAVVVAIVARVAISRRLPATAWIALVAFVVAVAAPAFATGGFLFVFRQPDAPRYLFPGVLLLFLVFAEFAAGLRLQARATTLAVAVGVLAFVVSLTANVGLLVDRAHTYRDSASIVKSKLAGADLAASRSVPFDPPGTDEAQTAAPLAFSVNLPAPLPAPALAAYYNISDQFGTPAYQSDQVSGLSPTLHRIAHAEYLSALRLNRGQ